jgi:spore coat assembly protein
VINVTSLKIGDIVARKSYGLDTPFVIKNITRDDKGRPVYVLKGLLYRIEADCFGDDLLRQNTRYTYTIEAWKLQTGTSRPTSPKP